MGLGNVVVAVHSAWHRQTALPRMVGWWDSHRLRGTAVRPVLEHASKNKSDHRIIKV